MTYFILSDGTIRCVLQDGTVLWIPPDPANTDYQRYLEWLAAGNVPQPWEG